MKRTINDVFDVQDNDVLAGVGIGELQGELTVGSSSSAGNTVTFNRASQLSVPLPFSAPSNNSAFCGIQWNALGGGGGGGGGASALGGEDLSMAPPDGSFGRHHPKRLSAHHHSEISTPGESVASSEGRLAGGVDANVLASKIEALTLKELNALSYEQRENVYEDVHGVSDLVEETPEVVRDKIEKLNAELERLIHDKSVNTTAYEQALAVASSKSSEVSNDRQYQNEVQSESFQLLFLRAAIFDVREAAEKIISYFLAKLELWGKLNRSHCAKFAINCFLSYDLSAFLIGKLTPCLISSILYFHLSILLQDQSCS